jgi:hypothetical protein
MVWQGKSVGKRNGGRDCGGVYAACVVVSGGGKSGGVCGLAAARWERYRMRRWWGGMGVA